MPSSRRVFDGSVLFGMQANEAAELLAAAVHTDIVDIQDRILSSIHESFPLNWIPQFVYQSLVNELVQLGPAVTFAMQMIAADASLAYPRFLGMHKRNPGSFTESTTSDIARSAPAIFSDVEFDEDEEKEQEDSLFLFLPLSSSDLLFIFATALFANQTPIAIWNGMVASRASALRNRLNAVLGQLAAISDQLPQARAALIRESKLMIAGEAGLKPSRESVAVASQLVTKTTTLAVLNQVAKKVASNAGVDLMVWSAILDDKTCLRCFNLNGKSYAIVNGEVRGPQVPLHFLCRCIYVPDFGVPTEESSAPKRNIDLSFGEWFKTLPRTVQLRILGRDRLALYLSGKLTLRSFVEFRNKVPIRVKQLNELRSAV